METPLTPLEFMRRARRLFGDREAVVDGTLRFTYEQFFDRCDRWSAALQRLGVQPGDRVAYVAPNTHTNLESFYAVPQIGAALVPINYRLIADDFAYIIRHCGAKVVCAAPAYLDTIDAIRDGLPGVAHFVSLEGARTGWIDYEAELARVAPAGASIGFERPAIRESDLLTINYTSGTTARPKGVMITHRNAWINAVGLLIHVHMGPGERCLWTLPMFHANGWTFTWVVTAVGATHVCPPKVEPARIFAESPHAFVVLRPGASASEPELREFARARLAHFKCPSAFHFVSELPKTATGKIQKFVLRGNRSAIATQ